MKTSTIIAAIWPHNQDLNFGEVSAVAEAAKRTADDAAFDIRKAKFKNAGVKKKLITVDLGFGNSAWVERTAYGVIAAKADFHPDDPIFTLLTGTARECFKAISSVRRAKRNNFLGKISLGKHAKASR